MKQIIMSPRTILVIFLLLVLCPAQAVLSQSPEVLDVDAVVCQNVVEREPLDAGTSFPADVEKLYCFSKIIGAKSPTRISHVWYYGEVEKFRISLPVNSASWRTFSSKTIQPFETGAWHVEILDASENKLEVINFQILNP